MLACAAAAAFCAGALQVPSWLDAPPKSVLSVTKTSRHAPAERAGHGGGLHNASCIGGSEAGGRAGTQRNPPAPCEPPCAVAGRHSLLQPGAYYYYYGWHQTAEYSNY